MLKVSLPAFLKREPKVPQNPPSENFIDELNLLEDTSYVAPDSSLKRIVKSMQIAIGAICTVYLLLSAYNQMLDSQLANLKQEVDEAYENTAVYSEDARIIKEIDKKTSFYKNILNSRSVVGENSSVLFENLGGTMSVVGSTINPEGFKITIEGNSPLDIAKLLNAYLQSGKIETIAIKSAALQKAKQNYVVEFEGVFK